MTQDVPIDNREYGQILGTISSLCENAKASTVDIYWQIGKQISLAADMYRGKSVYATCLLQRLSADLGTMYGRGFSVTNLKNMRSFYRQWDYERITPRIDWSNYVTLLKVSDSSQRDMLEERIINESLTNYRLRSIIQAQLASGPGSSAAPILDCIRGRLYTYRSAPSQPAPAPGTLTIDCGFSICRSIPVKNRAGAAAQYISTVKDRAGYTIRDATESADNLYFYKAYIDTVIDADTVRAVIDCGFHTTVRLKLRLRGIDAPELCTPEGETAAAYVKKVLKDCPLIGLKTWKNDKYGRYLADIFYMPGRDDANRIISEGAYLNQELLDMGLAIKA